MNHSQPCVWVVDDDPDDLFLMQLAFQRVLPALPVTLLIDSGTLLARLNQAATLPNLLLLDLNMSPQNGFDTLQLLRKESLGQAIPVVILTTSSAAQDRTKALLLGATDFRTKPYTVDGICQFVRQLALDWQLDAENRQVTGQ